MQGLKTLLKVLVLALALALPWGRGIAQTSSRESLFTVSGIEVDERAVTAAQARVNAIASAEVEAFQLLLARLIAAEDLERFTLPEGIQAADYVRGIGVENERNSRVRYIATLTITFDEAKIETLLGAQSIAYVGIAPKPALVFPLLWRNGGYLLWEADNSFRQAWDETALANRIMVYILPEGGLAERASLTPDQLIGGRQRERLQEVATNYGADQVMVVAARFIRGSEGFTEKLILEVSYPLTGAGGEVLEFTPEFFEDETGLIQRALNQLLNSRDAAWKAQSLTQFGVSSQMALWVPVESADDWALALARLRDTPIIQSVRVIRMALPESTLVIEFAGTIEQLNLALALKGLILQETAKGWAVTSEP